jgi:hypothetical protein
MHKEPLNLASLGHQNDITKYIIENDIKLLFIDNLSALAHSSLGNDINSWTIMSDWFGKLRNLDVSVIFVHHAAKKGDQRGSNTKEDNVDCVIRLSSATPKSGLRFQVSFEKTRYATEEQRKDFEVKLDFAEDGSSATWETFPVSDNTSKAPKGKSQKKQGKVSGQAEKKAMALGLWEDGLTDGQVAKELRMARSTLDQWFKEPGDKQKKEAAKSIGEARKKANKEARKKADENAGKADAHPIPGTASDAAQDVPQEPCCPDPDGDPTVPRPGLKRPTHGVIQSVLSSSSPLKGG